MYGRHGDDSEVYIRGLIRLMHLRQKIKHNREEIDTLQDVKMS